MNLSHETVRAILERFDWQWCGQYGEPGYSTSSSELATTPAVVLGDYWCGCDKFGQDAHGRNQLHSYDQHWPKVFAQLEQQGVELEWYDEWTIDYDNNKAYRTTGDSYSWQSVIHYTEDGEILTPDDELTTWLELGEYVNNPRACLPSRVFGPADLESAGWESYNGRYESGWHPGQTDDPEAITREIRDELGEEVEVVFLLDEASQFYIGFSAWTRWPTVEGDELEDGAA